MSTSHNTHQQTQFSKQTDLTEKLVGLHVSKYNKNRIFLVLLSILSIIGLIGLIVKISTDGFDNPAKWGYYVTFVVFILTTVQAAPMVAIAPFIAKGHWNRSITKVAQLFAPLGLINLILFIPVLCVLPSLSDGRRTLWFFESLKIHSHMPHIITSISFICLVLLGIALLWVSTVPDFAILRENSKNPYHKKLFSILSNRWIGTSKQWFTQKHRIGILGAFYFMTLVILNFQISSDFAMSLIPGWIDSLYPVTHAANSFQAGVATVILAMFALRKWGGCKDFIEFDQFWALGKLMFALSLMWIWFFFSSFIIFWYGAKPTEKAIIELSMTGPYFVPFLGSAFLLFILPLITMPFNKIRRSIWGPTIIAFFILIGSFLDRLRIYVPAYQLTEHPNKHNIYLADIPATILPDIPDIMIIVGGISAIILAYTLLTKLIPVISIWQQKELSLYKIHKKFHRTEVLVLGKPE